ncbi:UDP-N-acetylmuramate dehydrogenase [Marinobacter caseinilyticus]|uniref:UDP-N-acetylmuramate dehydrogenase n=1 Tax=Marinobacter caseinilyticus TaxID=2692195 RepID=UPI001409A0CB|nr:UDP-N-acetylmuramate dehydrogenase [Marinobacter caseinilyticus]
MSQDEPEITPSADLSHLNTLNVAATAEYFIAAHTVSELSYALGWAKERAIDCLVLGGGSNLVFAGTHVPGLVIRMAIAGRQWENAGDDGATLVLGAGENWHDAVLYAASSGYRGIENLALIPGTCGAAPVQNIGAYGVELQDTLFSVTALDTQTGQVVTLSNKECQFAYRDSLFKQIPGQYIILQIRLRLSRTKPLSLGYGDLVEYFSDHSAPSSLTALDIAEGIMAVRRRKLPDPEQMPNAGSFFKNPVVPLETWDQLKTAFPNIAAYPGESSVKLAAAWLIDQCGWKGYRNATVGVHSRQALVLTNHSHGSGEDILALAERIQNDVKERFGVALEIEPRIVPAAAR